LAFGIFNLQILGPDLRDQKTIQKAVLKNFTSRPKIKVVEFTTKNQSRSVHDQKSKSWRNIGIILLFFPFLMRFLINFYFFFIF